MSRSAFLTAPEAAVVANVKIREINRAIDERLLPRSSYEMKEGRRLRADACSFVDFYFATASELTSETRIHVIEVMSKRLPERRGAKGESAAAVLADLKTWLKDRDCSVQLDFLTVDLTSFISGTAERLAALEEARAMVVEDPEILDGIPVIRGTRVPVYDVAASRAAGLPLERIRKAYPQLNDRKIELAALYAKAAPARGRPRRLRLPPRAQLISEGRIARRRRA